MYITLGLQKVHFMALNSVVDESCLIKIVII